MPHVMPFARGVLASAIAATFAIASPQVDAAGLGRLTVQSALGQPLRAEVEITSVGRDEAGSLTAKIATPEQFRQAGMEFNPVLRGVRVAVERRADRYFLVLSSGTVINEPFVDLLVELNWATGRFVREYTFLLDPPELKLANQNQQQAAQQPAPATATAPAPAASTAAPVVIAPAPQPAPVTAQPAPVEPTQPIARVEPPAPVMAAPAPQPAPVAPVAPVAEPPAAQAAPAAPAAQAAEPTQRRAAGATGRRQPAQAAAAPAGNAAGNYQVKRGDTLAQIAKANKPAEVNLDQAIMAIYRANPQAFFGDINRLRSGVELQIPDAAGMGAVDATEARREVRVSTRNFAAYKQRLAGAPRVLDAGKAGQTAAGRIGAAVDDKSGTAEQRDQLKLSRAGGTGTDPSGAAGNERSRNAEAAVARDAALSEANARVKELERNVTELQKLLELKERSLASVQKQLDDAKQQAGKAQSGMIGKAADAPKVEAPKVEPPKVESPKMSDLKVEPKVEAPKMEPPKAELPVAEPPKAEMPKAEPPKAETPPVAATPGVPRTAAPESSLLDDWLWPGVGLLALLGAGYGFYAMRKRKKVEKFEDSLIAADAFTPNSLFGSTGGQSVDTSNPVTASGRPTTATGVPSTEVDPIAEAEVYIAYGREQQAEDILREALKKQPERQGIRLKLAEIYSSRKDTVALADVAGEMYQMTNGQNEEWAKVVQLGMAIDPDNALYSGSHERITEALAAKTQMAAETEAPSMRAAGAAAVGTVAAAAAAAGGLAGQARDMASGLVEQAGSRLSEVKSSAGAALRGDLSNEPAPAGIDFDLNLDTAIRKPSAGSPNLDLQGLDFGKPAPAAEIDDGLDFKIDLPTTTASAAGAVGADTHAMDLSSIGLSLEPSSGGPSTETQGPRWQEMATKLDLASAYEEIGDKEGARELLQEVLRDGDAAQRERAKSMISKIG